jgi:predicted metal-dependent hydrolase
MKASSSFEPVKTKIFSVLDLLEPAEVLGVHALLEELVRRLDRLDAPDLGGDIKAFVSL